MQSASLMIRFQIAARTPGPVGVSGSQAPTVVVSPVLASPDTRERDHHEGDLGPRGPGQPEREQRRVHQTGGCPVDRTRDHEENHPKIETEEKVAGRQEVPAAVSQRPIRA